MYHLEQVKGTGEEMNGKQSIKTYFQDSSPLSYDTYRYFHKCVSIAITRPQPTNSIYTFLQNCALTGTVSDQDLKPLRSCKAY